MAVAFELPTQALFERLSAIAGFAHVTRVLEDWDSSAPAKQPALMLTSGPIVPFTPNANLQGMAPPMWMLQIDAVLYVQSPSPIKPPSSILNPLIEDVCNALLKTAAEPADIMHARFVANAPGQFSTTLGGLCAACYVSGTIERSEGLIGHVAAASIPITMVLTS